MSGELPLLALIKGRLDHLGRRQKLIAENVANADTPGFVPRDLKPFTVAAMAGAARGGVAMVRTSVMHLPGGAAGPGWRSVKTPDSETTLDGNAVVLEEEMIKLAEARTDYDAAISLYQKSMAMLRSATRAPGR